jgi:hypothetical protein
LLRVFDRETSIRTFWILFVLTLLTIIGMQITGAPLITDAAPAGIVTFELIGTFSGSQNIIQSWEGEPMTWAGINMGLDFLFLALYAVTIALACRLIADKYSNQILKDVGTWLALGIVFAALLDIIENIALIKLLLGSQNEFLPVLAKWAAIPKFILVLLSLLYVIGGLYPALRKPSS